jgi:hypothetical protein
LTADAEAIVETKAAFAEDVEVADIEELTRVIVADDLPRIVPGLARPESAALSTVSPAESEVATDSTVESVEPVVATTVDTVAIPE